MKIKDAKLIDVNKDLMIPVGNTDNDEEASAVNVAGISQHIVDSLPTIPTKTSQLTNDSGFSTFSGSYSDLSNKPSSETFVFTLKDGTKVNKTLLLG